MGAMIQAGCLLEWRALHFFTSNGWPFSFRILSLKLLGVQDVFSNKYGLIPLLEEG